MTANATGRRSRAPRIALALSVVVGLSVFIARQDLGPSLSHVHLRLLSGPEDGNYSVLGATISATAAKRKGRIENVRTEGSAENVRRLVAAKGSCEAEVALVQAGLPLPNDSHLELYGHLAKAESLFFLGKGADRIKDFADLAHLRVGVGPEGSGTATVVRRIFESWELGSLGVQLSHHTNADQIDLAMRGELDLAAFVMDEDAPLVASAVRDMGLEVAGFPHADVIARRFSFLRHGRIGAGQFDAVRMLPPVDKRVFRVETMVVGNGCARRSQIIGLMKTLSEVFPDFVQHNRDTPAGAGLDRAKTAKSFIDNGGPDLLDEYLPRVGDVMPTSNWVHLVMALSVLFNLTAIANRFVLWRIDASRVHAEREIAGCFGPGKIIADIAQVDPLDAALPPRVGDEVAHVIEELEALRVWSRKASLSVLVPMGSEMLYRYQEGLIEETLTVLRGFYGRWKGARSLGA